MREYRCIQCTMELDETEYSNPDDAEICGYCFAAKISEIRQRDIRWPEKLCEIGRHREICFIADAEIRLEHAEKIGDKHAAKIYEKTLRLLNC